MIYAMFICSLTTGWCTKENSVVYSAASQCVTELKQTFAQNGWRWDHGKYWLDKTTYIECRGKQEWESVQ